MPEKRVTFSQIQYAEMKVFNSILTLPEMGNESEELISGLETYSLRSLNIVTLRDTENIELLLTH